MLMKRLTLSLLAAAVASAAVADDFDDMFSDDAFSDIVVEESGSKGPFLFSHEIGLQGILNNNSDKDDATAELYSGVTALEFNYRPSFSYQPNDEFSLNGELLLSTDTIFWLRADDVWSDEDIDTRQYQIDVRELVAQYRLANWQLSSGIQNVTLGLADALSVANVLYAQNLAVPGASDIDDTLMPAWTSIVSGSLGPVRLKLGSVHSHEVNNMPVTGTDFDTGLNTQLDSMGLSIEPQELALENMAWFGSASGVLGPLDWQLNAVSQLSHSPVIQLGVLPSISYPRTNIGSAALSMVSGSFLWKAEVAVTDGLQAQAFNGMIPGNLVEYQKAASTLGFDFDHSALGRLIAEIQYSRILSFDGLDLPDSAMAPDEQQVQWAFIYRKPLLRDQLNITAQLIWFDVDASGGMMQGLGIEYDVNDQLKTGLRYVNYVDGEFQFLQGAEDRDRIIASLVYDF